MDAGTVVTSILESFVLGAVAYKTFGWTGIVGVVGCYAVGFVVNLVVKK